MRVCACLSPGRTLSNAPCLEYMCVRVCFVCERVCGFKYVVVVCLCVCICVCVCCLCMCVCVCVNVCMNE